MPWVDLYMYAMDGPVYVCYVLPCMCVLSVALYMYAMGGPVYVCYGWTCICVIWVSLYMCAILKYIGVFHCLKSRSNYVTDVYFK